MEVEIRNYYKSNREGVVKGNFTLVIHPHGQKILYCKHFASTTGEWFGFPANKILKGGKDEYIPYVCYEDKDYLASLQTTVIEAIKNLSPEDVRQAKNANAKPRSNDQVWF